ncbi:hemagglutinin/amebocyte aggregation factor-like isoform X2 [Mixophyes fleayi]|uniref:hemagglutinin/amebocyte aggregation factor-like isoform X2 n=1 Tax=Mixophyes fleayi TaxID=3061075 RepID=UPI003F4DBF0D
MQVIVLLLLSIAAACAAPEGRWVNNYDQVLKYQCQNHQSISFIISIHDDIFEDRTWDFGCQNTFNKAESCYWTSYVNDFDQEFTFVCPFGTILSGMESYHDNTAEDRRWKFYCCKGEALFTRNCRWSRYVNNFDHYLRWDAPTNHHLTGAHSYHHNTYEDRRWRFHSCEKN